LKAIIIAALAYFAYKVYQGRQGSPLQTTTAGVPATTPAPAPSVFQLPIFRGVITSPPQQPVVTSANPLPVVYRFQPPNPALPGAPVISSTYTKTGLLN